MLAGQRVRDDSFILMFNAHYEDIEFTLLPQEFGSSWEVLIDTTEQLGYPASTLTIGASETTVVPARSTVVLKQVGAPVREDA